MSCLSFSQERLSSGHGSLHKALAGKAIAANQCARNRSRQRHERQAEEFARGKILQQTSKLQALLKEGIIFLRDVSDGVLPVQCTVDVLLQEG